MRSRWPYIWGLTLLLLLAIGKFGYDYFYFDVNKRETFIPKPTGPIEPLYRQIEVPAMSPSAPTTQEVQQALVDLGIPAGEVDGKWGQRTRQGFCIWRELTGREANRNLPIEMEARAIINAANFQRVTENSSGSALNSKKYQALKIPEDFIVGLNISKTCQSAVWVKDKARTNFKVTIASTGAPGLETDSGYFKVGWKVDRWYESIAYPDGWMYRPQFFNSGQAIHGSEYDTWVWWYPASHGCVRMLGKDIDELWAAGFGVGSKIYVYGAWNPFTQDPK